MAIGLLVTGGTILFASAGADGPRPTLPLSSLLAQIGAGAQTLFARVEELTRIDSVDMTPALMLEVADRVAALAADPQLTGVVVLHGSDTLEETAFVCDLLAATEKPVVFTAAMRLTEEVGADGPRNLMMAGRAVCDPRLRGLGVAVVGNDEIHAARWVRKMDSFRPSAFRSPGRGPLGYLAPTGVHLELLPSGQVRLPHPVAALPSVPIVQAYTGISAELLTAVARFSAARGIVLEGFGMGNVPSGLVDGVRELLDDDVTVVVTARTPEGGTHAVYGGGGVAALVGAGALEGGCLSAAKARLLLMLLLAQGDASHARLRFAEAVDRLNGTDRAAGAWPAA